EVDLAVLRPAAPLLAAAVLLDLLIGDPVYAAYPARLMGWTLARSEKLLRALRLNGYGGGILLFLILATLWCGGTALFTLALARWNRWAAIAFHIFLLYSLLALRDLLKHGWAVERAAHKGDLTQTRFRISRLVGRDTD